MARGAASADHEREDVDAGSSPEVERLAPEGELSHADLRALAQRCLRAAEEDRPRVVLDLSQVTHLDYRGVAALRAAQQLLAKAGGGLRLAAASPYVVAILRAAGAHGHLEVHATADEAVFALARPPHGAAW